MGSIDKQPSTVNKLATICKSYQFHLMEQVLAASHPGLVATSGNLREVLDLIEEIKRDAEKSDPLALRKLGFCYEQGLNDHWCAAVRKIIELRDLRISLYDQYVKDFEFNKQRLRRIELTQKLKELKGTNRWILSNSSDRSSYSSLYTNEELEKRKQFIKEIELLEVELASLCEKTYPLPEETLKQEYCVQLAEAEQFFLSAETYQKNRLDDAIKVCQYYQEAIQNGDIGAYVNLALCYVNGLCIHQDERYALTLLTQGAEQGDALACDILGHYYALNENQLEGSSNAHCYWRSAVQIKKNAIARLNTFLLEKLVSNENDFYEAPYAEKLHPDYYHDWAQSDNERLIREQAEYEFQRKLDNGWSFDGDMNHWSEDQLDDFFEEDIASCENYQAEESQRNIALSTYYLNHGNFPDEFIDQCSQSCQKLIQAKICWSDDFHRIALSNINGLSMLKCYVAGACYEGHQCINKQPFRPNEILEIKQDQNRAVQIWQDLAKENNPIAYYRLGCHYVDAKASDVFLAVDYLHKAADAGILLAHFKLIQIYYYGLAGSPDFSLASFHYKQIANRDRVLRRFYIEDSYLSDMRDDLDRFVLGKHCFSDVDCIGSMSLFLSKNYLNKTTAIINKFANQISHACNDNPAALLLSMCFERFSSQDSKCGNSDNDFLKSIDNEIVKKLVCNNPHLPSFNDFIGRELINYFLPFSDALMNRESSGICEIKNSSFFYNDFGQSIDWPVITDCSYVFNLVFNNLYLRDNKNCLFLGLLYLFKSLSPRCFSVKADQEIAMKWLEAANDELADYFHALILESSDPVQAMLILSKTYRSNKNNLFLKLKESLSYSGDQESSFDHEDSRPCMDSYSEKRTEELKEIIAKERREVEIRLKLRIEKMNALQYAERAEALKIRLEKLVQRTSHTLANTIFPNTLYQVAEHLKDKAEHRRDRLLLLDAYHAELSIRHENELLQQRYTTDNPEPLRQIVRGDRRTLPNKDARSQEDLLDYALSRVISRLLNTHSAKFNAVRSQIIGEQVTDIDALRLDFEDAMFFRDPPMSAHQWCSQHLRPIEWVYQDERWREMGLKREGLAEALLYGHFAELLYNAFKYADHYAPHFLRLVMDSETIDGRQYLTMTWSNPVSPIPLSGMGSNQGLEAIQEDLAQLNGQFEKAPTLTYGKEGDTFVTRMAYQADLLWLEPLPEYDIASTF
jgi:TPR repeat protein